MSDPSAWGRAIAAGVLAGAMGVLELSGASEVCIAQAGARVLKILGLKDVEYEATACFYVGEQGYEVIWSCTPTVLSICGLSLLWFARQPVLRYCSTCLLFLLVVTILILVNLITSVRLHLSGMSWVTAHYPGAICGQKKGHH